MSVAPLRLALHVLLPACVWGCAATGVPDPAAQGAGTARGPTGELVAAQGAMDAIVIGRSTKADVSSRLGRAIVVTFDGGYEVWVYRWPGPDRTPRAATELVVLFAPSGVASKVRLRPGYAPRTNQ